MIKTNTITISASPVTHTIPVESSQDINYIIAGTHAMGGAVVIAATGALTNAKLVFYYTATLTSYSIGANYLQFPGGDKLPAEYAAKECKIECIYNGSAWKTMFFPAMEGTDIIFKTQLGDDVVGNDELDSTASSEAVNTNVVRDAAITNAKMANMAEATFKMRAAGAGTGVPIDGTLTQARTALAQTVTMTGHVTGTQLETPATGVTTIATTIASNTITVAMQTNTVKTEVVTHKISLEAAGLGYTAIKIPFDCTVEEWGVSVISTIAGTDAATLTLFDNSGTLMTGSTITVTLGTTVSGSAPATSGFFNSSSITANNVITAGQLLTFRAQKTTAGGMLDATIKLKRT